MRKKHSLFFLSWSRILHTELYSFCAKVRTLMCHSVIWVQRFGNISIVNSPNSNETLVLLRVNIIIVSYPSNMCKRSASAVLRAWQENQYRVYDWILNHMHGTWCPIYKRMSMQYVMCFTSTQNTVILLLH